MDVTTAEWEGVGPHIHFRSAQFPPPSALGPWQEAVGRGNVALCHLSALSAFPTRMCWHATPDPGRAGTSPKQRAGLSHSVWLITPNSRPFPLNNGCSGAWVWVLVPL